MAEVRGLAGLAGWMVGYKQNRAHDLLMITQPAAPPPGQARSALPPLARENTCNRRCRGPALNTLGLFSVLIIDKMTQPPPSSDSLYHFGEGLSSSFLFLVILKISHLIKLSLEMYAGGVYSELPV